MNSDTVVIEDDDVEMEPVVILDEDDEQIISKKTVEVTAVEIIVLDDETPIEAGVETDNNKAAKVRKKGTCLKRKDISFKNNLRNNKLMDQIVTKCLNMENAFGMSRVIHKTLLPLYKDTNNTFKESELLKKLLKKTYKQLVKDPDYKFLHIKTLCEELKSGGLRRKVPFVTLATNLKNNSSQWENKELNSSSREIDGNEEETKQIHEVNKKNDTTRNNSRKRGGGTGINRKAKQSKSCATANTKWRIKTRSATKQIEEEKTDVIDLDDSENEYVDVVGNNDGQNDLIIVEEIEPNNYRNDNLNEVLQGESTTEEDSNKENNLSENNVPENNESENNESENNESKNNESENSESENNELENNEPENNEPGNNENNNQSSDNEVDYELLIPKNSVEVLPTLNEISQKIIASLEYKIAFYKETIDKLEEAEVTMESNVYCQCSYFKKKVVECYKRICEIRGESKDIVKRCVIRLHVAEGHPPGPAKRLEKFLNNTIDKSGTVVFPDFQDVVGCVFRSNLEDKLDWSKQQMIQEALALFKQCGEALRKRRQKREYRDLLSFVRDKEQTDDPAEKDPILLAKLEENKLIARLKEDQILERYVNMENITHGLRQVGTPQMVNAVEFESEKDSSDSDSESEPNVTLPQQQQTTSTTITTTTATINTQLEPRESLNNRINLDLLLTNNIILISTLSNNQLDMVCSSNSNDVIDNHLVTTNALPSTLNPMLTELLNAPAKAHLVHTDTNDNQCEIEKSSESNDAVNNNNLFEMPSSTRSSTPDIIHHEFFHCSDTEEIYSKSDTTETDVSANTATVNENSEKSSINIDTKNIDNSEVPGEPCNVNGLQNNVSSTTDEGVVQICDSSIKKDVEVKTEDNVKKEPVDIQSMLDELGDSFVCQVFDIEDPFLVIEISSDGFSDDDELSIY